LMYLQLLHSQWTSKYFLRITTFMDSLSTHWLTAELSIWQL
jgi:hypothetical protein